MYVDARSNLRFSLSSHSFSSPISSSFFFFLSSSFSKEPAPDSDTDLTMIIIYAGAGAAGLLLLIIVIILCCRYCRSRTSSAVVSDFSAPAKTKKTTAVVTKNTFDGYNGGARKKKTRVPESFEMDSWTLFQDSIRQDVSTSRASMRARYQLTHAKHQEIERERERKENNQKKKEGV